jgi:hypothetical protein
MKHFEWGAQRAIVKKMRPFEQTEVTSQWKTLEWFTQEGAPNIWYSNNPDGSYRLFSTPGTDNQSGDRLQAVPDKGTKDLIIERFKNDELATMRQAEMKKDKGKAAALEEIRQRFIREYVSTGSQTSVPRHIALIVLNGEDQGESKAAARESKFLQAAGIPNETPVFTSAFTGSHLFKSILARQVPADREFHPEDFAVRFLVIQVSEAFGRAKPDGITEMRTDDLVWVVKVISPADGRVVFDQEIRTKGIGFKDSDAQQLAIERAEGQLRKFAPAIASSL